MKLSFIPFMLSMIGEIHQRYLGYGFNVSQIFDGRMHHEHLILIFLVVGIIQIIREAK